MSARSRRSEVVRFGLDKPVGADDGVTYARGDADPTPPPSEIDVEYCRALILPYGFLCTWPAGHEHPQHVAGGTRGVVLGVSPR